jgi:hypothetical protein
VPHLAIGADRAGYGDVLRACATHPLDPPTSALIRTRGCLRAQQTECTQQPDPKDLSGRHGKSGKSHPPALSLGFRAVGPPRAGDPPRWAHSCRVDRPGSLLRRYGRPLFSPCCIVFPLPSYVGADVKNQRGGGLRHVLLSDARTRRTRRSCRLRVDGAATSRESR